MVAVVEPSPPPSPDVDALLGALGAAVDDVIDVDAPGLHADDRVALLAGVWHEADRLQVELAVLARAADLAGDWTRVGAASPTTWLALLTGSSSSTAKAHLRVGAALSHLHEVRTTGLAGRISWDATQILATTATPHTVELARRDEDVLVEQATRLRIRDLVTVVHHWRTMADAEANGGRPPDPTEKRSFTLGRGLDGWVHGRMTLDPEAGELVGRVLGHLAGPPDHGDRRTTARRRADALVELARAYDKGQLPGGRGGPSGLVLFPTPPPPCHHQPDPPTNPVEPEPPQPGGPHPSDQPDRTTPQLTDQHRPPPPTPAGEWVRHAPRTELGTLVDPAWASRLACDAPFARLLLDADGLPLDLGRDQRFATAAIWKALVARDGGCSHPWCDRPPGWCDAHHLDHPWDAGHATTSVHRMTLACTRHHDLLHHGGWTIHMHHGRPVWTDPHGNEVRPP